MSATHLIAFNEVAAKINTIHAKFKKEEQQGMSIRRKYWNCLYITNTLRTAHVVPVPVVPMGIENPDDDALNATVAYRLDVKTWIKPPPIAQDASGDLLEWRHVSKDANAYAVFYYAAKAAVHKNTCLHREYAEMVGDILFVKKKDDVLLDVEEEDILEVLKNVECLL
ncbi:hypothetical protein F5887DRAFT_1080485 [Amanita rubescens]|nr:hypothetical protein F5887DRAFT_1080485 [Amanita rubescens]